MLNFVSRYTGAALALSLLLAAVDAAGGTERFAIVLGNNLGRDVGQALRYAEKDANKMRDVLIELGEFPAENVILLLSANSTQIWQAIHQIEQKIIAARRKPGTKALLIIYYSGHASGDVLELGDSELRFDELHAFLRTSSADMRLAFLDSCQSGMIIAAKGGVRSPGFAVHVTDEIHSKGYAIITSSSGNELSQESAEIRGAFFTHYLISGLRGAGDKNGDGKVTLGESYEFAYTHTLARTSTTVGGSQHPMFEFTYGGRGEIVLTYTERARSRVTVNLPEAGRFVLLSDVSNRIEAEAPVTADQTFFLSVPPGQYRAYLITPWNDAVRMAKVSVSSSGRTGLNADDFETTQLETTVSRGGLFLKSKPTIPLRLSIGPLWRRWVFDNAVGVYGATLHLRNEWVRSFETIVRLSWAARGDVGRSKEYQEFGGDIGAGYRRPMNKFALRIHGLIGAEVLRQIPKRESRNTGAFNYLVLVGAERLLTPSSFLSLNIAMGGRLFKYYKYVEGDGGDNGQYYKKEETDEHRFDLQISLNIGWRWDVSSGASKPAPGYRRVSGEQPSSVGTKRNEEWVGRN